MSSEIRKSHEANQEPAANTQERSLLQQMAQMIPDAGAETGGRQFEIARTPGDVRRALAEEIKKISLDSDQALTPPTLQDIREAYAYIAENSWGIFPGYTKLLVDPRLEELSGGVKIVLALENRMPTGAYKIRGAFNEFMHLPPEKLQRGIVTASSGNHGIAVAWLANKLGIPCIVVVPEKAPKIKVEEIQSYGVKVIRHGSTYDDAYQYAQQLARERDAFYTDLSSRFAVAGISTWALEALEQVPHADAVIVPVGGGALINGTVKAVQEILVIGAEPARSPSNYRSFEAGELITVKSDSTIADGLKVNTPDRHLFQENHSLVDAMVLVPESEIRQGVRLLTGITESRIEGSGVLGVMALVHGKGVLEGDGGRTIDLRGKTVVVLITGGNIDESMMSELSREYDRTNRERADIYHILNDIKKTFSDVMLEMSVIDRDLPFTSQTFMKSKVELSKINEALSQISRSSSARQLRELFKRVQRIRSNLLLHLDYVPIQVRMFSNGKRALLEEELSSIQGRWRTIVYDQLPSIQGRLREIERIVSR